MKINLQKIIIGTILIISTLSACTVNKFNNKKEITVISRPFNIAVKENISAAAQDFINFIISEDGQKVIVANKYIKIQNTKPYTTTMLKEKL